MKKILLSIATIGMVGAAAAGLTGAYFSDTETSTGNTFTAGAIDLGVDNTSYYNGERSPSTTWELDFDIDNTDPTNPLEIPRLFFNFGDLKPSDYGEDTISLHVTNNEAWLCADVTLTKDDDNTCTEPENDPDAENGACTEPNLVMTDGDLADQLRFIWWADDGDNVLEVGERQLPAGPLGALAVNATATVALADSDENIWGGTGPVLTDDPSEILYVGKAWCFGNITAAPLADDDTLGNNPAQDNNGNATAGEPADGGYLCDGASVGNAAQTDTAMLNVSFRAVQARHNDGFQCVRTPTAPTTGQLTVTKVVVSDGDETAPTGASFGLRVDGLAVTSGVATTTSAGAHIVSEINTDPDYVGVIGGDDCDAAGNVTVPAGGSANCTITNTFDGSQTIQP